MLYIQIGSITPPSNIEYRYRIENNEGKISISIAKSQYRPPLDPTYAMYASAIYVSYIYGGSLSGVGAVTV